MGADGSSPVNLTPGSAAEDFDASFTPDGAKIVFVRVAGGDTDIFSMDANGANAVTPHRRQRDRGHRSRRFARRDADRLLAPSDGGPGRHPHDRDRRRRAGEPDQQPQIYHASYAPTWSPEADRDRVRRQREHGAVTEDDEPLRGRRDAADGGFPRDHERLVRGSALRRQAGDGDRQRRQGQPEGDHGRRRDRGLRWQGQGARPRRQGQDLRRRWQGPPLGRRRQRPHSRPEGARHPDRRQGLRPPQGRPGKDETRE